MNYQDIAEADAKGTSTDQLYYIPIIRQLLLYGCVDIVTAVRKDGDDKRWWGLLSPLALLTGIGELLECESAYGQVSGKITHTTNVSLAGFPSHKSRLVVNRDAYQDSA